jgi:hypothetical protein
MSADDSVRPYIELEPTDHPLAVEQRNGISVDRVAEIYAYYERLQNGAQTKTPSPEGDGVLFDRDT